MNLFDKKRKKCKCGNPVGKDSIEKGNSDKCGNCYWFFQSKQEMEDWLKFKDK